MTKVINPDAHCSECIWYESCANCTMYCKFLKKKVLQQEKLQNTAKDIRSMKNKDLLEIIDSRIKELFKEGILTACLIEETVAYSDSVSRSIEIRWGKEVLYSMPSEDRFSGL